MTRSRYFSARYWLARFFGGTVLGRSKAEICTIDVARSAALSDRARSATLADEARLASLVASARAEALSNLGRRALITDSGFDCP